jgi:EAL domain-containing protein (putative c-di-GMP-specific phosphodiesterase class I)
LDIVAEGVETTMQLRALQELGCTKAQGYLLSRPMPAAAIRTAIEDLERVSTRTFHASALKIELGRHRAS